MYEFVAAHLVVLVEEHASDVTLGQLQIARTFLFGAIERASLRNQTFAQVLETSTNHQATFTEGRLRATVDNLQEQFAHSRVNGIANQVGVQSFENGFAWQNFASHGSRVSHARAADGLNQSLLNHTLFHIQRQFASTLLRSAPTDTMRQTRDVFNLLGFHPFSLFRNGRWPVIWAFGNTTHVFHFLRINHKFKKFL